MIFYNPDSLVSITSMLSKYIEAEEIMLTKDVDRIKQILKPYIKQHSMHGLADLISILHHVSNHRPSTIVLECKKIHCHDCCYEYTRDDAWTVSQTCFPCCPCNSQITPKWRKIITENEERLKKLEVVCVSCRKTKDIMNFPTLEAHYCKICVDCYKATFQLSSYNNTCNICGQEFKGDCEIMIRGAFLDKEPTEDEIKLIYTKKCPRCEMNRDSRSFVTLCQSDCKGCLNCVRQIISTRLETCKCGQLITIEPSPELMRMSMMTNF